MTDQPKPLTDEELDSLEKWLDHASRPVDWIYTSNEIRTIERRALSEVRRLRALVRRVHAVAVGGVQNSETISGNCLFCGCLLVPIEYRQGEEINHKSAESQHPECPWPELEAEVKRG